MGRERTAAVLCATPVEFVVWLPDMARTAVQEAVMPAAVGPRRCAHL